VPFELCPRVGFIVTKLPRPAERVVAFYNKRATCKQWMQGRDQKWTRLSCRIVAANAVRLQLHGLASLCRLLDEKKLTFAGLIYGKSATPAENHLSVPRFTHGPHCQRGRGKAPCHGEGMSSGECQFK
jgi:hypothetical protein